MLTYAYVLARAGYGVMLLDFDGHGSAAGKLDRDGGSLQRNLDAAYACLLYTSDAADERSSVDLGGRRIIKKKKKAKRRGCYDHTTNDIGDQNITRTEHERA